MFFWKEKVIKFDIIIFLKKECFEKSDTNKILVMIRFNWDNKHYNTFKYFFQEKKEAYIFLFLISEIYFPIIVNPIWAIVALPIYVPIKTATATINIFHEVCFTFCFFMFVN